MTIQIPILLWTVICFVLFILIVNNFLFKPLLTVMDKRQEKIQKAQQKKEEHVKALAEADTALEAFHKEEQRHLADLVQTEIAKAHKDADTLISVTHKKQNQLLDLHVAQLEEESLKIEKVLDEQMETLSKLYASTLLS